MRPRCIMNPVNAPAVTHDDRAALLIDAGTRAT